MYQASKEFEENILSGSRTFLVKIEVDGAVVDTSVHSILVSSAANPGDYITIGGTVASSVQITMQKATRIMENTEFTLYIGLGLGVKQEYVKMGMYTVQKPQSSDGQITFTAYDRMVSKLCGAFFSKLTYPTDGKKVLQEISTLSGVPLSGLSTIPDGVVINQRVVINEAGTDDDGNPITTTTYQNPYDGYTYREALGYIAQLYGKFATINRDGAIELRWYTDVDYTVTASKYYDDLVTNDQKFELGTIECSTQGSTLTSGTGTAGIQVTNPSITQEQLDSVYQSLKDFSFLPVSLTFFGDMRLDIGDIVKVQDKYGNIIKIPVMALSQDFDGGLLTGIKSQGKTDAERASGAAMGPTAQALDRIYQDLLLVKEIVGNKANFDYVHAIELDVVNINANRITAGTLSVERLEIRGSTNSIVYELNNIDGALQSKQVDTLNGEIVTPRTINADKIIAGSITAEEINVRDLFAQKIVSTGSITGLSINCESGEIGGWKIGKNELSAQNSDGQYIFIGNGSNGNRDVLVLRTGAGTSASPYAWPVAIRATGEAWFGKMSISADGHVTVTDAGTADDAYFVAAMSSDRSNYAKVSSYGIKVERPSSNASAGYYCDQMIIQNPANGQNSMMSAQGISTTGTVTASGKVVAGAEIRSTGYGDGHAQFRAIYGNYGFLIRNDGNRTYFLLTNSGDPYGSWKNVFPLEIENSSGNVYMSTGQQLKGGTYIYSSSGNKRMIFNSNDRLIPTAANGASSANTVDLGSSENYFRTLNYGTALTKRSDRRDKEDMGDLPVDEAIMILNDFSAKKFTYKNDDAKIIQYGAYAQDVRDLLIKNEIGHIGMISICVKDTEKNIKDLTFPEEKVSYGLDYTQLIPVLVCGWKYHEQLIKKLVAKVG